MFSFLSFAAFIAFPESNDAILANEDPNSIEIETSGTLGLFFKGKCHKTFANYTLIPERDSDWCSNIVDIENKHESKPFIQFSIKGKKFKIQKYAVRNGCCDYVESCCDNEGNKVRDYCCCRLYSYSLLASNDRNTWTLIHKGFKDQKFYSCLSKTFDITSSDRSYKYLRFVLDEAFPGCEMCMELNQIEFYGTTVKDTQCEDEDIIDDESISIIGRIKKN